MINAKDELLEALNWHEISINEIVAAEVVYDGNCDDDGNYLPSDVYRLPAGWVQADLDVFLDNLDFDYNAGFGAQEVYGTVWLTDNRWLDRGEYDGSEWWELMKYPELPDYLNTAH